MAPWATSLAAAALTPGLGKCPPCCPLARPPRPPRLPPALPPLSHLGHPPSPRPHCRFSLSCTSLPFAQRRGGLSAPSRRAPSPGACPSASSPAVPCAPGRPETSLSQMSSRAVTRSGKFLCKKQHCSQPVTVQSLGEALCAQRQTWPLVRNCVGTWPGDRGSSPVTLIKSRQSAQGTASRGSAPARQGPPFPVQPSTPGCAFCCPSLSWEKTHRTNPQGPARLPWEGLLLPHPLVSAPSSRHPLLRRHLLLGSLVTPPRPASWVVRLPHRAKP